MANEYLNKEELTYLVQLIKEEFTKYVESEEGKGLSTEDFTSELKQKLENLSTSESLVYIPSVSESGDLSWTNNGGLENPATVNIKGEQGIQGLPGNDGADGQNGSDGVSVTHSWNGTVLSVTSASGTSSVDLKGETGETGPAGPDGYTPVRGTDYWTDADKAEIKSYVDEAILGGAW